MKAAVFQGVGRGHAIEEVPDPTPGPHDVVLKVEFCGICRTDLHGTSEHTKFHPSFERLSRRYQPRAILGHEYTGTVVATGTQVSRLVIGDRVSSMGMAGCGACVVCREGVPLWCTQMRSLQGGFAEYALANEFSSLRLPENLVALEGALIEPLACSHHAVDLASIKPGARVLILGAGIIGLGVALFARQAGAAKIAICARTHQHAQLAQTMGADSFLLQSPELAQHAAEALGGKPDFVFDCAGATGIIDQAMSCVAPRGTIVVAGLCMDPDMTVPAVAVFKELRVQYASAYRMADFEAVSRLISVHPSRMATLVTKTVTLAEFSKTFEELRGSTPHCKVLVGSGVIT